MPYDDSGMLHDDDAMFSGATPDGEPLPPTADDENPYEDFLTSEQPQYDEPDASLLDEKKRSPTAKKYERKAKGLFSVAVKVTAAQPQTLADSAALLMYGPNIAEKMGDLAADNARFARALDMLTDQTENAATALIVAAAPLVLQVIRNHEPVVEKDNGKQPRVVRIPFTKKQVRFRVGFKLGKRMRNVTNDPVALQRHVFMNPQVQEALKAQGINVIIG